MDMCHKAGFENINMDLMFSLPGQTVENFKYSISSALSCTPTHISCYGLIIEKGTPFYENGVKPLEENKDRQMYHMAIDYLSQNGFLQYEISNFSLPGRESRHNLKYWNCEEYFALGAGAHRFLNGKRSYNYASVEKYISQICDKNDATQKTDTLSQKDYITEKIIMGLRLKSGIDKNLISPLKAEKFITGGFMETINNNIRFTTKGFDVSNAILCELI